MSYGVKRSRTAWSWLPGQSGNPNGRPPDPPELKAAKARLTKEDLKALLDALFFKTPRELKATIQSPDASVLDVWLASIALKGIQASDPDRLEKLLRRHLGDVKTEISLEGNIHHQLPTADEARKILADDPCLVDAGSIKIETIE